MELEIPRSDGEAAVSELPEDELPKDLVLKVQARLPIASLARSLAVCRGWKAAVDSPRLRFLLLQERLECRAGEGERMLLVAGFRLGESEEDSGPAQALVSSAYDPATDRWYELPVGHGLGLPPWTEPTTREDERRRRITSLLVVLPRASMSPGVLLAKFSRGGQLELHIGNPVAGSWASLPPLPGNTRMRICRVWRMVDAVARRFKLVTVVVNREWDRNLHPMWRRPVLRNRTFVFDSAVGTWSLTTSVMPWHNSFRQSSGQGVFVDNVLYCLTETVDLLAYDVERESWSSLVVDKTGVSPISRYSSTSYVLFRVRGRLLCAPANGKQIWELDMDLMAWKLVASMPAAMYTEFRGEWLVGDSIYRYSVVAGPEEVYIMREWRDQIKIAAVDFRSTPPAWRFLPPLPYNGFTKKSFHCFDPWLEFGSWAQR